MIEVINITVRSLDLDYLDLEWEIKTTAENILKYSIEVLRSEASYGPFERLAGPFIDRYRFRDNIAPRRHEWRLFHYQIRVTDTTTQESKVFGPATALPRPPLDGIEIIRLETLLLREFTGRPCLHLPIRTFGQECKNCLDKVTGRRLIGNCMNCWGTGFLLGFHNPTVVFAQIDPFPKAQQNAGVTVQQQGMTTGRVSSFPYFKPRDLLIEEENRRWRVTQVSTTERLRAPIRQELQLTKITVGDIEYGIPITWPTVVETSPRSYETKSDLES